MLVGAIILVFVVIFAGPFLWLFLTALKATTELAALPIHWLPEHAQWNNFYLAMTMIDFAKYTRNSLLLAAVYSTLVTFTSAMVGFGFARLRAPGLRGLFIVMLATTMLPPIITVIPTYKIFSILGLIYTYWPWAFWGLASSPFLSFLFRQFFAAIPLELEDAAIIDGCGYLRIFWQVCLPLSTAVLATAAIFSFQWVWGDWITPLLFLNMDNTTLSVAISSGYVDFKGYPLTNVLSAGIIVYTLPVLVLFFAAQRYFVQGIVTTGLKG
jgi:ABC-type glycerol-3-phosphate transport system permease component